MKRIVLAAVLPILFTTAAVVAPSNAAGPAVNCKNAQTTYEINFCAGQDYQKADKELNAIYKQLFGKYDDANKKLLQTAQRAWMDFRDKECAYETNLTIGGTIHSTMVTNCDTTLTLDRIKQLKAQLNCEEGDMSCNHP